MKNFLDKAVVMLFSVLLILNAFQDCLTDDLESNTGEMRQKRFTVLTACAYGTTSLAIYYTKSNGNAILHIGSAYTYALVNALGCSYPSGKYSGSIKADSNRNKKVTLKELFSSMTSQLNAMQKTITSQRYYGTDDEGYRYYRCYDTERGYWTYGPEIKQVTQKYGSDSLVLFSK